MAKPPSSCRFVLMLSAFLRWSFSARRKGGEERGRVGVGWPTGWQHGLAPPPDLLILVRKICMS